MATYFAGCQNGTRGSSIAPLKNRCGYCTAGVAGVAVDVGVAEGEAGVAVVDRFWYGE